MMLRLRESGCQYGRPWDDSDGRGQGRDTASRLVLTDIGTTYVAVQGDRIVGFVTVSSGEMVAEKLAKTLRRRLPAYPLPILRLARLAVDERFQRHGIGRLLLRAMLTLALEMRDRLGCIGVVVDAKPDVVTFYSSLGFKPIGLISGALGDRPEPIAMFLSTRQIATAITDGD